ncbi:MAG: response regulator [Brevinematales bacterium]|nr:response regulator [Brevinematales bacterium]
MKVMVYTQSYFVRNMFVTSLIPQGINLIHVENADSLMQKLSSDTPDIVVMDVIREDFDEVFQLVKAVKSSTDENVKKVAVILLISAIDKQYITAAVQLGVIGFIKNNSTGDFIASYLIKAYEKIKGAPPDRKFARVSLDPNNPNEKIGVKFRSPVNLQLIIGVIKDISFGGLALELVGTFPEDSLAVGMEIKNMQFMIEGKDIDVDAVVVAYQKKFCAFRFVNMSNDVKDTIAHFIFQRLSGL